MFASCIRFLFLSQVVASLVVMPAAVRTFIQILSADGLMDRSSEAKLSKQFHQPSLNAGLSLFAIRNCIVVEFGKPSRSVMDA